MEISPLCNQQADSVPAIQIGEYWTARRLHHHQDVPQLIGTLPPLSLPGFISYIVAPLFEEWHRFTEPSPLSHTMMGHLHRNQARWSRLLRPDTQTQPRATEPRPGGEGEDIR